MASIRVIGPSDQHKLSQDWLRINTTSHAGTEWTSELSPFLLGPCRLYDNIESQTMENAWQYAKAYSCHVDARGVPTAEYWKWARAGWSCPRAVRYPMGKGAKPEFLLWAGERLGYVEGRLRAYWPLYRDAVRRTSAFKRLQGFVADGRDFALFDFDGYDHDARGITMHQVLTDSTRPMGHAFVLKAMLLCGPEVTPDEAMTLALEPSQSSEPKLRAASQLSLFG